MLLLLSTTTTTTTTTTNNNNNNNKVTHYIFYANRTIVVGFALEGKEPPTCRLKISLIDKGAYLGHLHPIYDIKPMAKV